MMSAENNALEIVYPLLMPRLLFANVDHMY